MHENTQIAKIYIIITLTLLSTIIIYICNCSTSRNAEKRKKKKKIHQSVTPGRQKTEISDCKLKPKTTSPLASGESYSYSIVFLVTIIMINNSELTKLIDQSCIIIICSAILVYITIFITNLTQLKVNCKGEAECEMETFTFFTKFQWGGRVDENLNNSFRSLVPWDSTLAALLLKYESK